MVHYAPLLVKMVSSSLWDLNKNKTLYTLEAKAEVHALASPNRYWLAAATTSGIKIFKLQERSLLDELKPEFAVGATAKNQSYLFGLVC